MDNKPQIKKKERMVKKKGKRERKQQLSEKKEDASNVSEQRDKGVIRVHDTTHKTVTTTQQGNRRSRTTRHKERMRGLVKQ